MVEEIDSARERRLGTLVMTFEDAIKKINCGEPLEDDLVIEIKNNPVLYREIRKVCPDFFLDTIKNDEVVMVCSYCGNERIVDGEEKLSKECEECKRQAMKITGPYFKDGSFNGPLFVDKKLIGENRIIATADDILWFYIPKEGYWDSSGEKFVADILAKSLRALYKKKYLDDVIAYLVSMTRVKENASDLFNKTGLINVKNGVVDSRTCKLLPKRAEYYFSYSLPVEYSEEWEGMPALFDKMLVDVFEGDFSRIISVYEAFAYTLIPDYPIQKAIMFVGGGQNGKSTILNVLQSMIGTQHISKLSLQQISEQRFATVRLMGKLANVCADIPSKQIYDSGLFKALTGSDSVTADRKHRELVDFKNSAKLFFSANEIPVATDGSDAYFRRWQIIEFNKVVENPRASVAQEISAQGELNRLFGLLVKVFVPILREEGSFTYTMVTDKIRQLYLLKSDSAAAFVENCISYDPGSEIKKSEVFQEYENYCKAAKLLLKSEDSFWQVMKKRTRYDEKQVQVEGVRVRTVLGIRIQQNKAQNMENLDKLDIFQNIVSKICTGCTSYTPFSLTVATFLENIKKEYTIEKKGVQDVQGCVDTNNILEKQDKDLKVYGFCPECGQNGNIWDVQGKFMCESCKDYLNSHDNG